MMMMRRRRRTGSKLQCSLKQQWNMFVLVGQDNRFFPVEQDEEEEEEEEEEEDENKQQEENEIRTTM